MPHMLAISSLPKQVSWHGLEALSCLSSIQDLSARVCVQTIPALPGIAHLFSKLTHLSVSASLKGKPLVSTHC